MVGHALPDEPATAARIAGHLRWLVGDGGDAPVQVGRREEAFAAWRRLLHGLAARRPLVLVLEDLHWADDALLDFLEELLEPPSGRAAPVPLLVVVTARPELLLRRPGWCGTRPGSVTELAPLSEADTGRLLEALLSHHRLPESVGPALLAATGGNPLFAEEYVRMLRDRHPLPTPEADRVGPELPLPESVHAIVAARLDSLPAEREYGFRHVLVRDVAYGQIPRAERASKHRRAAGWLESLGPDQVDRGGAGRKHDPSVRGERGNGASQLQRGRAGRSELLAHHYGQALALASAAGEDTGDLSERARLALRDAGDRVVAL